MFDRGLWAFLKEIVYTIGFYGFLGFFHAIRLTLMARITHSGDIAKAARNAGIPVHEVTSLNHAITLIRDAKIDFVLASVATRVSKDAICAASIGWINTHCGPLPRYAGQNSPFWVLLHDQSETAVTLHYMDVKFDAGPIIAQQKVSTVGHTYFSLAHVLFDEALMLHKKFLANGKPLPEKAQRQNLSARTYFGKPTVKDGKAFRQIGKRFV